MAKVVHLLSGLQIGGKERAALRLAERAIRQGYRAELVLYESPFRSTTLDFDPGEVPTSLLKRGPGIDVRFAFRLATHLRDCGACVVHAHNPTALFYAVVAAAMALPARPRVIATIHAWPAQSGLGAKWVTRAAAAAASVVAVSDELATLLVERGWLSRCQVIHNGVETDRFTPDGPTDGWRDRLGVGAQDFLVGQIARFDPVKRHADLLGIASGLAKKHPRIIFVLVGQGLLLDRIRREAEGLENLRFIPQVTDMPPLLRSLDAVMLCSAHEGMPLALLEGMACGLPVIATDVGGIGFLVRGAASAGPAGLLALPGDLRGLARAVIVLATDTALRSRLAHAARRRSLDFQFEGEWAAYESLYTTASPFTPEAANHGI